MSISKFGKIVDLDMLMSELTQIMGVKVGKSLKLNSFDERKEKKKKKNFIGATVQLTYFSL